mmetsp:Transcript_7451/g.20316  ORF Transcript_7451/g.20316 Transcript_7451/m.20316 type:complete len:208 (+) Transcript_7451:1528-2151(+)
MNAWMRTMTRTKTTRRTRTRTTSTRKIWTIWTWTWTSCAPPLTAVHPPTTSSRRSWRLPLLGIWRSLQTRPGRSSSPHRTCSRRTRAARPTAAAPLAWTSAGFPNRSAWRSTPSRGAGKGWTPLPASCALRASRALTTTRARSRRTTASPQPWAQTTMRRSAPMRAPPSSRSARPSVACTRRTPPSSPRRRRRRMRQNSTHSVPGLP